MERETIDQTKVAIQALMNIQQLKAESAAISAESDRLKATASKVDAEITRQLHENVKNEVFVPNKIYLIGTKGYIVRKERMDYKGIGLYGEPERFNVWIEMVDIA